MALTKVSPGLLNAEAQAQGFRNRIINGDMRIDQRNAGAAVTASDSFPVDRWKVSNTTNGAFSAQQDSSVPAGFVNSVKISITTAQTAGTGNLAFVHNIEGYNTADFGFGSANAKTITMSFWVRSSSTGTFGGALRNSASDRSYPFTYTISSADTWEQKSVTVSGDTSGTWLTNNGKGVEVRFSLFAVASSQQTAGAWYAGNATGATGQTQLASTLNATWYITGVQLEVGSVATEFERRPYGTELALCQRYYQTWGGTATYERIATGYAVSTTAAEVFVPRFNVVMRSTPTLSYSAVGNFRVSEAASSTVLTGISLSQPTANGTGIQCTVASGLTTNRPMSMDTNNTTSARLNLSAEL